MSVKVEFLMPDLEEKLKKHLHELMGTVAAIAQTNRGMLFDHEGAYNGRSRWPDLKLRVGMILSNRGVLRKSIAPQNDGITYGRDPNGIVQISGEEVTIGTRLYYARMMNDGTTKLPGGVLRPVRAKALKIPLPSGKSATEGAKALGSADREASIRRIEKKLAGDLPLDQRKALRKQLAALVKRKTLKKNEGFIFRKSVKIPARPFDDWNNQDQEEMTEALARQVVYILNR